jgi:hypothetical protein
MEDWFRTDYSMRIVIFVYSLVVFGSVTIMCYHLVIAQGSLC